MANPVTAKLVVTVVPTDTNGNFQTGLTLKLRRTNASGGYSGTTVNLAENASEGFYYSSDISDLDFDTSLDPDVVGIGSYEVWEYSGATPTTRLLDNYMIGASYGVVNALNNLNTALAGKSDTSHNHNAVYYTETEADALLAAKAALVHNHNTTNYTETEVDALLAAKSDTTHVHSTYQTEAQVEAKIAEVPAKTPTFSVSGQLFPDLSDVSGVSDNVAIPLVNGMVKDYSYIGLHVGLVITQADGFSGGYIEDSGHDIASDAGDIDSDWVGAYLYISGTKYEIEAVSWNAGKLVAKLDILGDPDLSSVSSESVEMFSGDQYAITLIPIVSSTATPAQSEEFIFPVFRNTNYQEDVMVPLRIGRPYKLECRSIRNGVLSVTRTIASYTSSYSKGSSSAGNVTLTAAEYGVTISISKSGDWANADAFEICWTTATTASFSNEAHRKAITYSTTFDVPLGDSTLVNIAVRPLRNGLVIADTINTSIVSGGGGEASRDIVLISQYIVHKTYSGSVTNVSSSGSIHNLTLGTVVIPSGGTQAMTKISSSVEGQVIVDSADEEFIILGTVGAANIVCTPVSGSSATPSTGAFKIGADTERSRRIFKVDNYPVDYDITRVNITCDVLYGENANFRIFQESNEAAADTLLINAVDTSFSMESDISLSTVNGNKNLILDLFDDSAVTPLNNGAFSGRVTVYGRPIIT